jgi:hypothetical protein
MRKSFVDLKHDISGVTSVKLDVPEEQDTPLIRRLFLYFPLAVGGCGPARYFSCGPVPVTAAQDGCAARIGCCCPRLADTRVLSPGVASLFTTGVALLPSVAGAFLSICTKV